MDDGTAAEQTDESEMNAISGGSRASSWFDHLINGLSLVAITALVGVTWRLSDTVARLETSLAAKGREDDREFIRIDTAITRHDQRITDLERSERSGQRDANRR